MIQILNESKTHSKFELFVNITSNFELLAENQFKFEYRILDHSYYESSAMCFRDVKHAVVQKYFLNWTSFKFEWEFIQIWIARKVVQTSETDILVLQTFETNVNSASKLWIAKNG